MRHLLYLLICMFSLTGCFGGFQTNLEDENSNSSNSATENPQQPQIPTITGKSYYVDAIAGSDLNDGMAESTPFKTLAKINSVLAAGDGVFLKRGQVWHETLTVNKTDIVVQPYGVGVNPLLHGDGSRLCVLVSSQRAFIYNIDAFSCVAGVMIQGVGASGSVVGGTYDSNGVGIVVGGGGTPGLGENGHGLGPAVYGQLILAENIVTKNSLSTLASGDGIQIGEEASNATHTIRNLISHGNSQSGLNVKSGIAIVESVQLLNNGWTGYTAQNNLREFHISDSLIEGNSAAGNGTGQASIEDHVKVFSTRNTYKNSNVSNYTAHIRMAAQDAPNSWYVQGAEFHSSQDKFLSLNASQGFMVAAIGAYTTAHPNFVVEVLNATFETGSNNGIAIDAYGATQLKLMVKDSTFKMTDTRAIRIHPSAVPFAAVDFNGYKRADGGVAVEVQDTAYFNVNQLDMLYAQFGLEQHGVVLP